ncbi:MAG: p-cresol methylhydroxylase [Thiobacillus sp. SCN 63-374]|nr:MAG: p-cresol methylhydroxylase [Thiobacillus sp. SCN 63-374]
MKLPAGVSTKDFNAAMAAFRRIVGEQWVFTREEDVALYRDAYSPLWDEADELVASAAVAPETVEQVQAVVRAANQHKIPLFAISTGKNLGYGGSAPNLSGSVIVDLKRMNKVIEVDDKRNFCIVEPGVSYFDLYRYIQERKLKVMMDIPDPGWGSPLGNALDHGVGYTWGEFRDHFGAHCGMEVVLPDGEVMRTGMAAVPGAKTWGENKYGYGPYVDGLFAQSNFGIVTKMGFWMMPEPEHFLSCQVSVPRYRDIVPLVDIVNYLEDQGLIGNPRYSSPLDLMTLMMEPERVQADQALLDMFARPGGASAEEFENYARSRGLEYWRVLLNFYGPKETVYANWTYAKKKLAGIDGVKFEEVESYALPLDEATRKKVHHQVAVGIPNMSIFSIGARSRVVPDPQDGHIWLGSIISRSGEELIKAHQVFGKAVQDLGITPAIVGPFTAPAYWVHRTFIFMVPFFVSRSDKARNAKVREQYVKLVELAAQHGWTEYRTGPAFQDVVAKTYSFNDNALLKFRTRLKDAIDPNGIIAPGRGGIWPKRFRGKT